MPTGVYKRTKKRGGWKYSEEIKEKMRIKFKSDIKERYIDGETLAEIAKSENCCDYTIWNRLNKMGVSTTPKRESSGYGQYQAKKAIKRLGYQYNSKKEHIHHIDGNTKNNDIMNLLVVTHKEHSRIHIHLPYIIKKRQEFFDLIFEIIKLKEKQLTKKVGGKINK